MPIKTLAQLVDDLFCRYRHASGREYKYVEVSRALDGTIDPTYFSKLRMGKIQNPTRNSLLALCTFFEVPGNYFFPELDLPDAAPLDPPDDAPPLEAKALALLHAWRGVTPELQDSIYDLVRKIQQQSPALIEQAKERGA